MTEVITNIWMLIDVRRYVEAKEQIRNAITATPNNAELFYASAYIAWMLDENSEGIELCNQGLTHDPESFGLLYIKFNLLKAENEFALAEEIIIQLLAREPRNADYLCGYADLMMRTFHLEKARRLCDEALRVEPEHSAAKSLSYLLNIINNNSNQSDAELAELVRLDPESEHLLSLIVHNLIEKKKYSQAQQVTQELIRIDPKDEDYIELAIELKSFNHWTSIPNWLFNRFGWPASIIAWAGVILLSKVIDQENPWLIWVLYGYIAWVVYSWVQPPLLIRWLRYRGL